MKTLSHYDANRACGFIRENGRPPSYIQPRKFDSATGNDAYTKRTFTKEFFGVSIGIGNPAWGASNNPVFIIKCGDIIATRNTHEKEINP